MRIQRNLQKRLHRVYFLPYRLYDYTYKKNNIKTKKRRKYLFANAVMWYTEKIRQLIPVFYKGDDKTTAMSFYHLQFEKYCFSNCHSRHPRRSATYRTGFIRRII